jgi:hypothetical protein
MEIIFRAHDGREFDNAQDCVTYENAHPVYRMWSDYGETEDFSTALVVDIQGDEDFFIKGCHEANVTAGGICGKGLYVWSQEHFEWILLDECVQKAISEYIRNE